MIRWLHRLVSLENRFSQARLTSVVLLGVPFVVFIIYSSIPPVERLVTPDSATYMYFDPIRPIGYPTFLYIIKHVTGGYESLRHVQLAILCMSAYIAAISLFLFWRQLLIPLLFELGTLGHPGLVLQTESIMSDPLSTAAFLLFIAAVFHFGCSPSLRRYGLVCGILAVAITLRPVNVAMLLPALLLPLFFRHYGLRIIPCLTIGVFAAVAGWGVTPAVMHGKSATSYILAVNLFHRTIYMKPGKEPLPKECDSDFIEEITMSVRAYLEGVPPEFAGLLRSQYTEYVRFASVVPGLVNRHNFASESQTYPILMCYTLALYRQAPLVVLRDIAVNYWNLISNYTFIDKDTRSRLLAFLQAHPPVLVPTFPLANYDIMYRAAIAEVGEAGGDTMLDTSLPPNFAPWQSRPFSLILGLKLAQLSAAAVSLVLVMALLPALLRMTADRDLIILGLISLVIQLNLLIAAIADVAQARYVFPVWPGLWLVLTWSFVKIARNWKLPSSFSQGLI
jgi:hypothetical protein